MRLTLHAGILATGVALALFLFTTGARGHHVVTGDTSRYSALELHNRLTRALTHHRYVMRHGRAHSKYWHTRSYRWTRRSIHALEYRTIKPWLPTKQCEEQPGQGWRTNTGNGYYGGVQFDLWTWRRHGGLTFAVRPHKASPFHQVIVAKRLEYDGWPNCPNP